jgi:hypothetical protein
MVGRNTSLPVGETRAARIDETRAVNTRCFSWQNTGYRRQNGWLDETRAVLVAEHGLPSSEWIVRDETRAVQGWQNTDCRRQNGLFGTKHGPSGVGRTRAAVVRMDFGTKHGPSGVGRTRAAIVAGQS